MSGPSTTVSIPRASSAFYAGKSPTASELARSPCPAMSLTDSTLSTSYPGSLITEDIPPISTPACTDIFCTNKEIQKTTQKLFNQPELFPALPINLRHNVQIVRDFITKYPEQFSALDQDVQQVREVQIIALIAARFLNKNSVLQTLCDVPEREWIEEDATRAEKIGNISDALWNIYSFAFYSTHALHPRNLTTQVPPEFTTSWPFVLYKVKQNGLLLEYFPAFQNDPRILRAALDQNLDAIQFVPEEWKSSHLFLGSISNKTLNNSHFLEKLPHSIKINPYFIALLEEEGRNYIKGYYEAISARESMLQRQRTGQWTPADSDF